MPPNSYQNPASPNPSGYGPVGQPASSFKKKVNTLLIPLILAVFMLLMSVVFGVWAFMERQDYKDNSDQKSAAAVEVANKALTEKLNAEFTEREKSPLEEYKGPAALGSLTIKYPKTWSVYVVGSDRSSIPLDGYMHPSVVPGEPQTAYALRFQVANSSYDDELQKFESLIEDGTATATPLTAANVANVVGIRIAGQIDENKRGTVVLFPLRDKTLVISTEAESFNADLNDIILKNLTFVP